MSWKNKHQNIIFICRGGIKLMFFMCAFMKFPLFFNTKRYFYTKKKNFFFSLLIPDFIPPWPWPYLSQALRTFSCQGGIQLRMKSEGWENPPTKGWFQTVFLLQLPPPPGSAEKFPFHEPPGEQISELPPSLASLPTSTRPRASLPLR